MLIGGQLCGPNSLKFLSQRGNGDGRREERREQTKVGLMHITDPKHRPKTDLLREYKEPDGGFLLQCVRYATVANFTY